MKLISYDDKGREPNDALLRRLLSLLSPLFITLEDGHIVIGLLHYPSVFGLYHFKDKIARLLKHAIFCAGGRTKDLEEEHAILT